MIHQKDGGQVGLTISHYKILEKLLTTSGQVGEGGMSENHPRLPTGRQERFLSCFLDSALNAGF